MVERKTLRNVLDEVLSSVDDKDAPGLEGLSALIHRQLPQGGEKLLSIYDDSSDSTPGSTLEDTAGGETFVPSEEIPGSPAPGRRKATHYLSEKTLDDLGWARSRLGRMLTDKLGESPSNSEIVDKALKIVLDDFQQKGMDSTLVQKILAIGSKTS